MRYFSFLATVCTSVLALQLSVQWQQAAAQGQGGQNSTVAPSQLQNMLNQYDRPGLWSQSAQGQATQKRANIAPKKGAAVKATNSLGFGAAAPRGVPKEIVPPDPAAFGQTVPKGALLKGFHQQPGAVFPEQHTGAGRLQASPATANKPPATLQTLNPAQLNQMMDQYDQPTLWSKTPASSAAAASPGQGQVPMAHSLGSQMQSPLAGTLGAPAGALSPQSPNPLSLLFGGAPQAAPAQAQPASPMQAILRTFLGGGGSGSNGSSSSNDASKQAQNQEKLYNAQNYLQTAINQASRAQSACERASYGSDMSARQSAASEAYYAAQAARAAANNATAAAAGGSESANDAAAQARDAADRAQASADLASSNANGGGGW